MDNNGDETTLQSEYTQSYRYLNIELFDQYPWGIFEEGGVWNRKGGLLKCGIYVLAKRKNCEQWHGGKLQNSVWVCGSNQ